MTCGQRCPTETQMEVREADVPLARKSHMYFSGSLWPWRDSLQAAVS